jgi:PIN domain nuclease of toxin-antitoxin system
VKLLLDTHLLLWAAGDPDRLLLSTLTEQQFSDYPGNMG